MPTAASKISARLDRRTSSNLNKLRKQWSASTTEALSRAVNEVAERTEVIADPLAGLDRAGFIGGFAGAADLSQNYKRALTESLSRKHGHR